MTLTSLNWIHFTWRDNRVGEEQGSGRRKGWWEVGSKGPVPGNTGRMVVVAEDREEVGTRTSRLHPRQSKNAVFGCTLLDWMSRDLLPLRHNENSSLENSSIHSSTMSKFFNFSDGSGPLLQQGLFWFPLWIITGGGPQYWLVLLGQNGFRGGSGQHGVQQTSGL